VSKLRATDVSFTHDLAKHENEGCPANYVKIHEDSNYSMGIFVLRPEAEIPLHDHPDMCGLMKVIYGQLRLKSYTALPKDLTYTVPKEIHSKVSAFQLNLLIPTRFDGEVLVKAEEDETCLLTPSRSNFHQVMASNGPAAFLDILAPPYDCMGRDCHYYSVVGTSRDSRLDHDITWLLEIDVPPDFWCTSAPYYGPKI
jgi:cysteamine dioxygenase